MATNKGGNDPSSTVANRIARARGVLTQGDIERQRRDIARIAAVGDLPQTLEGPVSITGDLTISGVQSTDLTTPGTVSLETASLRITTDSEAALLVEKEDGTNIFQVNDSGSLVSTQNAADFRMYSGAATGLVFGVDGATGDITIVGDIDTVGVLHSDSRDGRWEAGFHANYGAATYTTVGMAAVTTSGTLTGFNNVAGGPYVLHTTGAVSGNISQVVTAVSWRADWGIDAVFKIRGGADLTNVRYYAGLFSADPSASSDPAVEYAGFRFDDSLDTNWRCASRDAATRQTSDSMVPPVAGTTQTLRIATANGASYEFSIDGAPVSTHSTNVPVTSTQLFAYVSVTTRAAEANTIRVHHAKVLSR